MPLYRKKRRVQTSSLGGMEVYTPETNTIERRALQSTSDIHIIEGLERTSPQPMTSLAQPNAFGEVDGEGTDSIGHQYPSLTAISNPPSEDVWDAPSGLDIEVGGHMMSDVEIYASLLSDPAFCPLVYKNEQEQVLIFCVPVFDEDSQKLSTSKFHFTGFRLMQRRIACWCDCSCEGDWAEFMFWSGGDVPNFDQYMDTRGIVCNCATAVLSALDFGETFQLQENANFLNILENSSINIQMHEGGLLTVAIKIGGRRFLAVKRGQQYKWGLIQHYDVTDRLRPKCLTCPRQKHYCEHVQCLTINEEILEGTTMEDFERVVEEAIDPNTGRRKLTCISQDAIPESQPNGYIEDEMSRKIIQNRMAGNSLLPNKCIPCEDRHCGCGENN